MLASSASLMSISDSIDLSPSIANTRSHASFTASDDGCSDSVIPRRARAVTASAQAPAKSPWFVRRSMRTRWTATRSTSDRARSSATSSSALASPKRPLAFSHVAPSTLSAYASP
jgi:hypothetical protein